MELRLGPESDYPTTKYMAQLLFIIPYQEYHFIIYLMAIYQKRFGSFVQHRKWGGFRTKWKLCNFFVCCLFFRIYVSCWFKFHYQATYIRCVVELTDLHIHSLSHILIKRNKSAALVDIYHNWAIELRFFYFALGKNTNSTTLRMLTLELCTFKSYCEIINLEMEIRETTNLKSIFMVNFIPNI